MSNSVRSALILLTTACPIECDHCQYFCTASKEEKKWVPERTLKKFVKESYENGVRRVKVTGGEPFYDLEKLLSAIDIITEYFPPDNILLASSGFWATDEKRTEKILNKIVKKGIKNIEISVDRFHLKKMDFKNIENILKISKELDIRIILRPLFDEESETLLEPIANLVNKYHPDILFSITDPIGRAEKFDNNLIGRNKIHDKFVSMIKLDGE